MQLDRRKVVNALLAERGTCWCLGPGRVRVGHHRGRDTPLNFPLWGAMGSAAMIGLGLAIAQPGRPVW